MARIFERFSDASREVFSTAVERARALNAPELGAIHLLLGLTLVESEARRLTERYGLTEPVLSSLGGADSTVLDRDALAAVGVDLDAVRQRAEATFGPGAVDTPAADQARGRFLPTGDEARAALDEADRVAELLVDDRITPEHLLLGLLIADRADSEISRSLTSAGLRPPDFVALRREVIHRLTSDSR